VAPSIQRYGPFVLERPQPSPEVFLSDADAVVARWQDFFLAVWKGETHMEAVDLLDVEMRRYRRENPVPVGLLMVVAERAALPAAPVRAQMSRHMRRTQEEIRASALVYEGGGFRAAAIRAVVTGINMVTKTAYPHKVFDSVSSAADWVCEADGIRWADCASNLNEVVATLRREAHVSVSSRPFSASRRTYSA
jgi:hypothetical protein